MDLKFERRGGRTILSQCRYTLPLQALTPFQLEDGTAYLMLLNPTGGVLGGDSLMTRVHQGNGTHVLLTTPSATRVYRASRHPAIQHTAIHLGDGAMLEYIPDHIIPHAGASLCQTLRINLSAGSKAIVLESLAAGRLACGERWSFRDMDLKTEVFLQEKALLLNRARITPHIRDPSQMGVMENFNYMTSFSVFADGFADWGNVGKALQQTIDAYPGIFGGVSVLACGGCAARYLARNAPELVAITNRLWSVARWELLGLAPFPMRKY